MKRKTSKLLITTGIVISLVILIGIGTSSTCQSYKENRSVGKPRAPY